MAMQRLLRGVLGIRLLPADPSAQRVHTVVVPAQQRVERPLITLLGGADEGAVVSGWNAPGHEQSSGVMRGHYRAKT